jgi:acyl-homoserine lactone acylase PvdQ
MDPSKNIWRDAHGVCHVQGADKAEVFELMGYAHGKDRAMQIPRRNLNFSSDMVDD